MVLEDSQKLLNMFSNEYDKSQWVGVSLVIMAIIIAGAIYYFMRDKESFNGDERYVPHMGTPRNGAGHNVPPCGNRFCKCGSQCGCGPYCTCGIPACLTSQCSSCVDDWKDSPRGCSSKPIKYVKPCGGFGCDYVGYYNFTPYKFQSENPTYNNIMGRQWTDKYYIKNL